MELSIARWHFRILRTPRVRAFPIAPPSHAAVVAGSRERRRAQAALREQTAAWLLQRSWR